MGYLANTVGGMSAYGYGDSIGGIVPYYIEYAGYQEYLVNIYETFYIEPASLNLLYIPFTEAGYNITYCNPALSFNKRLIRRPTFTPKRVDFFNFAPYTPNTIDRCEDKFNYPGETGHTTLTRVVIRVQAAGFVSRDVKNMFGNDYREILVSAKGKYTVEQYEFQYTNPNNPNPSNNFNGIQVGSRIKFFTEDEYSIVCFNTVEDIRIQINTLP